MAGFWWRPPSPCVLTGGGEQAGSSPSYQALIPAWGLHPHDLITWGLDFNIGGGGGHRPLVHNTVSKFLSITKSLGGNDIKVLIVNVFAFNLQIFLCVCVPFCICKVIISIYNGTNIANVYFKFCSPLIFTLGMPSSVSVAPMFYLCGSLTATAFMLAKSPSR